MVRARRTKECIWTPPTQDRELQPQSWKVSTRQHGRYPACSSNIQLQRCEIQVREVKETSPPHSVPRFYLRDIQHIHRVRRQQQHARTSAIAPQADTANVVLRVYKRNILKSAITSVRSNKITPALRDGLKYRHGIDY